MSWTFRKPRVTVQPGHGWQAPHQLVDEYAARGVRIAELTGTLATAQHQLILAKAEIREQDARLRDLEGRIECQADNHEADRAEWAAKVRDLEGQVRDLQEATVAMAPHAVDAWDKSQESPR